MKSSLTNALNSIFTQKNVEVFCLKKSRLKNSRNLFWKTYSVLVIKKTQEWSTGTQSFSTKYWFSQGLPGFNRSIRNGWPKPRGKRKLWISTNVCKLIWWWGKTIKQRIRDKRKERKNRRGNLKTLKKYLQQSLLTTIQLRKRKKCR